MIEKSKSLTDSIEKSCDAYGEIKADLKTNIFQSSTHIQEKGSKNIYLTHHSYDKMNFDVSRTYLQTTPLLKQRSKGGAIF